MGGSHPRPGTFCARRRRRVVPYRSSVDAVQTLTAAGGQAQLVTISGAGHEVTGIPPGDVIDAVARWLHEVAAVGCG